MDILFPFVDVVTNLRSLIHILSKYFFFGVKRVDI